MVTQTRIRRLRDVFRCEGNELLDAQVASLSVLYEDLRVEMTGIAARSLPVLDVLEPEKEFLDRPELIGNFRQLYFMRRSIATVTEFAETLRLLHRNPRWTAFVEALRPDSREYATETLASAIAFFAHKEPLIKKIRNDIGGHFGQKTARSALSFIAAESIGKMEIVTKGDDSDIRLNFATEIAASALLKHLPGQNIDAFKDLLTDTIIGGYRHATRSVQIICGIWLWQRFGH